MGLLDDAIRQHLELKRRHGADPSDVAKLEHEAFGPVAREEALEPPDADDAGPQAAATHETAREEELAYEASEHDADAEWDAGHPEPASEPEPVEARAPEPEPPEPEPIAEPEPEPAPEHGSVRLEDAAPPKPDPQPDAGPGEHDELEETPEFLQETPEHDRLWFEQKPPRDFDF